ncbi:hypothetical protein [Labrys neptuniae]|uniref:Uncharacterized protein n=1 Tax=Labrys neptuniae TaxID=376174 RepID=A0ABV3PP01_9HYPH
MSAPSSTGDPIGLVSGGMSQTHPAKLPPGYICNIFTKNIDISMINRGKKITTI